MVVLSVLLSLFLNSSLQEGATNYDNRILSLIHVCSVGDLYIRGASEGDFVNGYIADSSRVTVLVVGVGGIRLSQQALASALRQFGNCSEDAGDFVIRDSVVNISSRLAGRVVVISSALLGKIGASLLYAYYLGGGEVSRSAPKNWGKLVLSAEQVNDWLSIRRFSVFFPDSRVLFFSGMM